MVFTGSSKKGKIIGHMFLFYRTYTKLSDMLFWSSFVVHPSYQQASVGSMSSFCGGRIVSLPDTPLCVHIHTSKETTLL